VSIIILIIALGLQYTFHFPLNKLSKKVYWQNEKWMEDNNALFKTIPKDASIASSQNLVSHLSHRKEIYLIWPRKHKVENDFCKKDACWWLDFAGKPQYLVVDLHPNQWATQLLETNANFESAIGNMEDSKKISLIRETNYAKLYRINYQ